MTRVRYFIIILGMSKSSGFQNCSVCLCLWLCLCCCICHWLCLCICVLFYDFWIAFIISFQNMYGCRGLWSLRAEIMIIFEVMTDIHTHTHSPIPLIDSAHPGPREKHPVVFSNLLYLIKIVKTSPFSECDKKGEIWSKLYDHNHFKTWLFIISQTTSNELVQNYLLRIVQVSIKIANH